jgi:hypothetical protein
MASVAIYVMVAFPTIERSFKMTMNEWECDCRADAIFKTEAEYEAHFETDPYHKEED